MVINGSVRVIGLNTVDGASIELDMSAINRDCIMFTHQSQTNVRGAIQSLDFGGGFGATGVGMWMYANARYDGSNWVRFHTTYPSWAMFIENNFYDAFKVQRVAPGSGSITWTDLLSLSNAGDLTIAAGLSMAGGISTVTVITGTYGSLYLNAGYSIYTATGFAMKSPASKPYVVVELGDAASSSFFVYNSTPTVLFGVDSTTTTAYGNLAVRGTSARVGTGSNSPAVILDGASGTSDIYYMEGGVTRWQIRHTHSGDALSILDQGANTVLSIAQGGIATFLTTINAPTLFGTYGLIYLDATRSPHTATGVVIESPAAKPYVIIRLGDSTNATFFGVANFASTTLFSVTADGYATVLNRLDAKHIRATGVADPTTGAGTQMAYTGGQGYLQAYDHDTSTAKTLNISASGGATTFGGTITVNGTAATTGGLIITGGGGATTTARFGSTVGTNYFIEGGPIWGMNTYYNSGFKFGVGSSGHYAGWIGQNVNTGAITINISTATGSANASATFNTFVTLSATGSFTIYNGGSNQLAHGGDSSNRVLWDTSGTGVTVMDIQGSASELSIQTSSTTRWKITHAGNFVPGANNTYDIGSASLKVANVYATNGVFDNISATSTGLYPDGAVGTPSISFTSDTNTGLYRSGSDDFRATAGGTDAVAFKKTGSTTHVLFGDGTGAQPSISFISDTNIGIAKSSGTLELYAGNGIASPIKAVTCALATVNLNGVAIQGASTLGVTWLKHHMARVRRTADQTISNNTWTTIAFASGSQVTDINTGSMFTTSANTVFTFAFAGVWIVHASVSWASNSTGQRGIRLLKNGATLIAKNIEQASNTGVESHETMCMYSFAQFDTVQVDVFQDSGGNLAAAADGEMSIVMEAAYVANP